MVLQPLPQMTWVYGLVGFAVRVIVVEIGKDAEQGPEGQLIAAGQLVIVPVP